jgi:hypothetical protein
MELGQIDDGNIMSVKGKPDFLAGLIVNVHIVLIYLVI